MSMNPAYGDVQNQGAPGSYSLYPGTPSPSWWNAPSNPMSIGAGTSEQGYGWGVPSFGAAPIQIDPSYLTYLQGQTTGQVGSYIPGSASFNGWDLSRPGLVGTVGGVENQNLRYGQGGTGDPTTGREPQTPDEWVQGGKLFTSTRTSNWGQGDQAGSGLDYIANLFLRSDTPSGIGTPAWNAPESYWRGLAQQIEQGTIVPTNRGWAALQAKGITPAQIGQHAVAAAQSVGVQPSGAGASGASTGAGGGSATQQALGSIAASQAADQAARLAYQVWTMRVGDEKLAMEKATEAWRQTFQQEQQKWNQQYQTAGLTGQLNGQDTLAALQQQHAQKMQEAQLQLAQAGLTGTYEGNATLQRLQQEHAQRMQDEQLKLAQQNQGWSQGFQERGQQQQGALSLLQLQSQLQGPADWLKYQQLNANTPGGLKDMLAGFSGQYGFANSGYQGTPGPATLGGRTQDLLSGGQLGQGGQPQTAQPAAGGAGQQGGYTMPAPNQVNLKNWSAASPSAQQMMLGAWGAQGMYQDDVLKQLAAAAPRYSGPTNAQVSVR